MTPDPAEIPALREAVVTVKAFLASVEPDSGLNDLLITGVEDHGDLWLFAWNNAWPLLGQRAFEYLGCHPIVVFKADGRLIQIVRSYTQWIGDGVDGALEEARTAWRSEASD